MSSPVERLKTETNDLHDRLERVMASVYFEDGSLTVDSFRTLLTSYYGLYRPLDRHLKNAADRYTQEYTYRERSERLRDDLLALSLDQEQIHQIPTISVDLLPVIQREEELFGCLYVVEGSELGGHVIRKQIEDSLNDEPLKANAFFTNNPEETRTRWKQFTKLLNSVLAKDESLKLAIQKANETFQLYEQALS